MILRWQIVTVCMHACMHLDCSLAGFILDQAQRADEGRRLCLHGCVNIDGLRMDRAHEKTARQIAPITRSTVLMAIV